MDGYSRDFAGLLGGSEVVLAAEHGVYDGVGLQLFLGAALHVAQRGAVLFEDRHEAGAKCVCLPELALFTVLLINILYYC